MCKFSALPALFGCLLLASCSTLQRPGDSASQATPKEVRPEDVAAVDAFFKNGGKGGFHPAPEATPPMTPDKAAFVVDLDGQRAYLYNGGQLIAASTLASGRKYYRTETGDYTLGQKDLNHRSTSYGSYVSRSGGTIMSDVQSGFDPVPVGGRFEGAMMKYFMRFAHNGKPTAMGFHRGELPGYPASHGCVRLPGSMAAWFFEHVPMNTPIYVRGTKYGIPIGASQNRPRRSPKVHSSLKKPAEPAPDAAVPPAPESEVNTPGSQPAPAAAPAPSVTPESAPAP